MADKNEKKLEGKDISRRQFLKMASVFAVGLGLGDALPRLLDLGEGIVAIPASGGYILVDTKKCAGCTTCMMACSMVHEGKISPSLSRIQILQNPYGRFPEDIGLEQCRQCAYPACVDACPTGALHADAANRNVRMVDERKCIGCQRCVEACPHKPSRAIWNFEKKHSQKCDLCVNTPYWDEKGGPDGKQACVAVCPMKAIKFTKEIPNQTGEAGYDVNLRGPGWVAMMGGGSGGH